jgi:peptidoglycan-N-acetylglucosamine deacetylase
MQVTRRDALLTGIGVALTRCARAASVPDRTVVLTFDDAVSSDFHFIAPLLRKYHLPATFFVCEFPPDFADKKKYMSWDQIKSLHQDGFEIGSHTRSHTHVTKFTRDGLITELKWVEDKLEELGIPRPVSFAYPAYETNGQAVQILKERGYRFARAGGSRTYRPNVDNSLLMPSFSTTGPDEQRVIGILNKARDGQIVILTIHGAPDYAHPAVTTPPELFKAYLAYLTENNFNVVSVRDLARYSI